MYQARIKVTLRPSILDPQGKAAHHALSHLGMNDIEKVRIGKFIEMNIDAVSLDDARAIAREACSKLLANPVMEEFEVDIQEETV